MFTPFYYVCHVLLQLSRRVKFIDIKWHIMGTSSFIQRTRQWRIIDNGESLVKILQNFLKLRQNIIYHITQSFTFIYALGIGKRIESKFHRTIKSGLLKRLTPIQRCLVYCSTKSNVQIKCVSYLVSKHLIMTTFALL